MTLRNRRGVGSEHLWQRSLLFLVLALAGSVNCALGQFVYVANGGSNDVSVYAVDAATGALKPAPGSPFTAGVAPAGVAVDRASKFAYVANGGSNDVSAYTIDAAT